MSFIFIFAAFHGKVSSIYLWYFHLGINWNCNRVRWKKWKFRIILASHVIQGTSCANIDSLNKSMKMSKYLSLCFKFISRKCLYNWEIFFIFQVWKQFHPEIFGIYTKLRNQELIKNKKSYTWHYNTNLAYFLHEIH